MRTVYFDIDDKTRELEQVIQAKKDLARPFLERYELSWIYHENALEGLVLEILDLKAALEHNTLEDGVLIPTYQRIRNIKHAIDKIRKEALGTARMPTLSLIKQLHVILSYGITKVGGAYRKDIPIHRNYFHDIVPPGKIGPLMNKLVRDMKTKEFKQYHPIRQASEVQFRLMTIFPFDEETGKVARLVMNYLLLRSGYFPVIIPDVDRQHYYESLRLSAEVFDQIVIDCMERMLDHSLRYFNEGGRMAL